MARRSGVYRYTVDRTQVPSQGAATYYGFVGASKRGRIDKPIAFLDRAVFENACGNPDHKLGYAGISAAATLGQNMSIYWQRVVSGAYRYSRVAFGGDDDGTSTGDIDESAFANPKNMDTWDSTATGLTNDAAAFMVYGIGPGEDYDNLEIKIVSTNMQAVTGVTATIVADANSLLSAGVKTYVVIASNASGSTHGFSVATSALTSGQSVDIKIPRVSGATGYSIYRVDGVGTTAERLTTLSQVSEGVSEVTFRDDGSITLDSDLVVKQISGVWGIPDQTKTPEEIAPVSKSKLFTLEVYDPRVSTVEPRESFVVTLQPGVDSQNNQTGIEEVINDDVLGSQLIRISRNNDYVGTGGIFYTTAKAPLKDGADGDLQPNTSAYVKALENYSNPEVYSVNVIGAGGNSDATFIQALASLAGQRNDCTYVCSVPAEYQKDFSTVAVWRQMVLGVNSTRGMVVLPQAEYFDGYSNEVINIPMDCVITPLLARNDAMFGIHQSPAGVNRGVITAIPGVRRVTVDYGPKELDQFAADGVRVNPVAFKRGYGYVLRDQFTLQNILTALSYFSVRRVIDAIELSIEAFAITKLQELPTETLDTDMYNAMNSILEQFRSLGAIKAYRIYVGAEAGNTAEDNIRGVRKYKIALVPNVPVREIELWTYLFKDEVQFEEVALAA